MNERGPGASSGAPLEVDTEQTSSLTPVHRVPLGAPFVWVAVGWRDLRRAPLASLFYGVAFAIMGWLLALVFRHAYEYTSALAAGFLLIGPFLATGTYDISRRLQASEAAALPPTLSAWRANVGAIGIFAIVLMIIMLVWARASLVVFALFFSTGLPTLTGFLERIVSLSHLDFVLTYLAVGAVFATIVFAVSVVSVPMMLDRGTDAIVAALTSIRALLANPGVMLVWAALIVALIGIGFATLFVGLIITAPLLGHATWHAYKALVGADARA
jgi:uncharacterized membrane protein